MVTKLSIVGAWLGCLITYSIGLYSADFMIGATLVSFVLLMVALFNDKWPEHDA